MSVTTRRERSGARFWLACTVLCLLSAGWVGADETEVARSADYVIGVEDVLLISVWEEKALAYEIPVRPDGKIGFPLAGDVMAAGRTPTALGSELTESLSRFIKDPFVTVIVKEINSFKVYVLGEVAQPGVYVLKSRTRLLQALAQAGGLSKFASKTIVIVREQDGKELRLEIDYRKLISGAQPELNVFLKPGDTIIVN